jgi:hypothetical protein
MTQKGLFKLIMDYMSGKTEVRGLDIWEIELTVAQGGEIKRVQEVTTTNCSGKETSTLKKTAIKTDSKSKKTHWKSLMVNYSSMGFGARVGLGFDSKRTKSRNCNKMMYAWEGFKKITCKGGGPTMQNLIQKLEIVVDATQTPSTPPRTD